MMPYTLERTKNTFIMPVIVNSLPKNASSMLNKFVYVVRMRNCLIQHCGTV